MLPAAPAAAGDDETARRNPAIAFFQDHISAADGNRCPMTPSCSAYAARAVQKHGLVIGWIMACDRLVRCGRDEARISPHIRIKGREYISDPVSANDFWWFSKKEDK
ncbi:MAG: membrane protein insertion efficiency factor YidD [Desulfobacter sp.]|nr:MAG: membrane protein insertion efficiency factor YidD [Desulfobacter sp.]